MYCLMRRIVLQNVGFDEGKKQGHRFRKHIIVTNARNVRMTKAHQACQFTWGKPKKSAEPFEPLPVPTLHDSELRIVQINQR